MTPKVQGYRILKTLGRGTSGTVYEVLRERDGKKCALKVLDEGIADPAILGRLFELSHPHLLTPLSLEETQSGQTCLVFRLVNQIDAHLLIAEGGAEQVLSLLIQATGALSYLHDQEIIHGDIKPQNLLCELTEPDLPFRVQVLLSDLDYAMESDRGSSSEGVTGTLGYLAPEILSGGPCTFRSDVFSLGAWLYWLITGTEPFSGDSISNVLSKAGRNIDLAPPARVDGRFASSFWGDLIGRMTSREPEHRFSSGKDVLHFILENLSIIDNMNDVASYLVWNPNALMPHEREIERKIRQHVFEGSTKPWLFIFHGGRHKANREIVRRISMFVSNKAPNVIHPEELQRESMDRVLRTSQPLVVDNVGHGPAFQTSEIATILRLFALRQVSGNPSSRVAVLLQASANDADIDESVGIESLFDVVVLGTALPDGLEEKEFDPLFSGALIDTRLLDDLRDSGCTTADLTILALEKCLGWKALSVSMGRISIHPKKEIECRSRIAKLIRESEESSSSTILYGFFQVLPDGLSAESVAFLQKKDDDFGSLVARGTGSALRWSNDGSRLASRLRSLRSGKLSREARIRVREMCNLLRQRWPEDRRPQSVEELVCRVFGSNPSNRDARRAVAYARMLLHRGLISDAHALVREDPDLDVNLHKTNARWKEVRSRTLNAAGRFDDALDEAKSACSSFVKCGLEVLAGKLLLDFSIEAGGWSRPGLGDSLRDKARQLLSLDCGKKPSKLLQTLWAEDAQSAFSLKRIEDARRILVSLKDLPKLDSRAGAVCHRLLALSSLSIGDVSAARTHYWRAILAAEESRDFRSRSRVLISIAAFHFLRGYYSRAEKLHRRVLNFPRGSIRNSEEYAAWTGLGGVAYESGKLHQALDVNLRALALCEQTNDSVRIVHAESNVALILSEMGRSAESLTVAMAALKHEKSRWSVQASRVIGRNYSEIGQFALAEEFFRRALSEDDAGRNPIARANTLSSLAVMEHNRENDTSAFSHASHAKIIAEQLQARDELLIADCLRTLYDPSLSDSDRVQHLGELLIRSEQIGNLRIQAQIRASIAEKDETIPLETRIRTIDGLLGVAVSDGYGSFVMRLLEIKSRLLIENRESEKALDVLRECLNRIKVVSDGLADAALRKVYLADPRRQRILEMIRQAKSL